ncbi:glutamate 2,3-aminomutase [Caloranaerobacter azorensis]|uniref:Glutamate 2,3-aminomutase n=1 Tax=Caloranaerobacter azorensis TaxID=116090 RepID=A0A6P1YBX7_9FIRM|nr:glutamate 2,3-aminomutase [Caloranaerobacter azorensis]QIB26348.1 glutamate 2,3-aminomutase [Caloranaerobacter azorensis]
MDQLREKREISLKRAAELKSRIDDYLKVRESIPRGLYMQDKFEELKKKILDVLGGTQEDWDDYKWQLSNRITDVETLSKIINLSEREKREIEEVGKRYRWAISPYYASLMDPDDRFDPIRLMAIPTFLELAGDSGESDPMGEEYTNPAGSITRRYPDRLIINVTNECAMYCRHCQRRRNIGQKDEHKSTAVIEESIRYIRENREIRDVLITGGDPLTLPDHRLEWILKELRAIPHVEIIRIGSRTPVTMPQRITDELVNMLKKYHPLYLNTHFNHPKEVTEEAKKACEKLANAGIPLGNQAVLLNGINNDKFVMRALNHELLKIRVKPYYIFHAKHVIGTLHFNTSLDDGLEIMEYLRGYTSGMAVPTYIINAPKGQGKTPILPQYLISRGKDYCMIRTWEGKVIKYENHPTRDIKEILS